MLRTTLVTLLLLLVSIKLNSLSAQDTSWFVDMDYPNLIFPQEIGVGQTLGPVKIGEYYKVQDCPGVEDNGVITRTIYTTTAPFSYRSPDFEFNEEQCTEGMEYTCSVVKCDIYGTFHPQISSVPYGLTPIYSDELYFLNQLEYFYGTYLRKFRFYMVGLIRNSTDPFPQAPPPMSPEPLKTELAQTLVRTPRKACGSIIEVDNQSVGESIPITGTPFSLFYYSDRVPGRLDNYKITVPLVRGQVSSSLSSIDLTILYGNREFSQSFVPTSDLSYDFFWDGKDENGKFITGSIEAIIAIVNKGPGGETVSNRIQRIGGYLPRPLGLNGWIFNVVHFYDVGSKTVYLGNGGSIPNTGIAYQSGYAAPSVDGSEIYLFDASGKHIKTKNSITGDDKLVVGYNASGRIVSLTDVYGNKTSVAHQDGFATKIIAPNGQITKLEVDENGWLSKVQNPNDESYSMTYRSKGLLGTFVKPGGQKTVMTYDPLGFLIKDQSIAGNFLSLFKQRNEDGWVINTQSAEGRMSKYELTSQGGDFSRKETDSRHLDTIIVNKDLGESYKITPEGLKTTTLKVPDPRFNSMAPLESNFTLSIEGEDLVYKEKNIKTYSIFNGDVFKLRSFVGKKVVGDDEKTFSTSYESSTRMFTSVSAEDRRSVASINSQGDVSSIKVGNLLPVTIQYDAKGRSTVIKQGERETQFSYDVLGNLAQTKDAFGKITQFQYDLAGRVIQKNLPDGSSVKFTYDKNGNLTSLTPAARPTHKFSLNNFELVSQYLPPLVEGKETGTLYYYNYDKQLTEVKNSDGSSVQLNYDLDSGALNSVMTPSGKYTYSYNPSTGLLSQLLSPDQVELSFLYKGSLLEKESINFEKVSASFSVNYNKDFSIGATNIGDGKQNSEVALVYDRDGFPVRIGSEFLEYDLNGLLITSKHNDIKHSFSHNGYGELLSEIVSNAKKDNLFSLAFKRDHVGRISQKSETVGNKSADVFDYQYDENGRLTDVLKGPKTIRKYVYDANGNRIKKFEEGKVIEALYDDQDRLLTYGKNKYKYNDRGQLVEKLSASGKNLKFDYDVFGNLKKIQIGKDTIEYIVDGQNRRVGKKVNGKLVQAFIYQSQTQIAAELDGEGNIVKQFVYGTKLNIPDYFVMNGKEFRIVSDQVGTPKLIIELETGKIIQRYEFDEFGVLKDNDDYNSIRQSKILLPFGFAGGLLDTDTYFVRFGARDYDSEIGRWSTKDLFSFGGGDTNLYGYAFNDPISFIDLDGFKALHPFIGANPVSASNPLAQRYGLAEAGLKSTYPEFIILAASKIAQLAKVAFASIQIQGPGGGGRLIGSTIKIGGKSQPLFRIDNFPIETGGPKVPHYHSYPNASVHNTIPGDGLFAIPTQCPLEE